jgi:hypothetical protein
MEIPTVIIKTTPIIMMMVLIPFRIGAPNGNESLGHVPPV